MVVCFTHSCRLSWSTWKIRHQLLCNKWDSDLILNLFDSANKLMTNYLYMFEFQENGTVCLHMIRYKLPILCKISSCSMPLVGRRVRLWMVFTFKQTYVNIKSISPYWESFSLFESMSCLNVIIFFMGNTAFIVLSVRWKSKIYIQLKKKSLVCSWAWDWCECMSTVRALSFWPELRWESSGGNISWVLL